MNYSETLDYIHSLGMFSHEASLERITRLLDRLGNPQGKFPAVHIAGTNGKGSTAAMTASVFRTAGLKTALFVSPYIIDFRERIQINGSFISEDDLVLYSSRVKEANVSVTEFEFITAVAFLYFAEQKCDVAVVETGLGGRLDATNTLSSVLVSVITKIGLDHTALLGETIEKITKEKCGIIRNSVTVTNPYQQDRALKVIKESSNKLVIPDLSELKNVKADISGNSFIYKGKQFKTMLGGDFQIENAVTAIEAVRNSSLAVSEEDVYSGLASASFPARCEVVALNPLTVIDGAHNPDGADALVNIMNKYKGRITAIVGMMRDKSYEEFLSLTMPLCKNVITVMVKSSPRSLSAEELCASAKRFSSNVLTAGSYEDAIRVAKELCGGEPVFVFGSLYLAAGIRPAFL